MKNLDIIIPLFNEEDNILELVNSLNSVKDLLKDKLYINFIFVNDGSTDESPEILKKISWEQKHVKVISFSRNFGYQLAVTAGLDNSSADYVCIMDSDMQDPPSLINDMYKKALEGFDIIYGKFLQSENDSFLVKSLKDAFNWLIKKSLNTEIYLHDDFIFLSKDVVDTIKLMPEKHRFLREMIGWTGYKSTIISFDRDEFYTKNSKYSLWKLYLLFIRSVLASSTRPLKLIYVLAIILAFMSLLSFFRLNMLSSTILFVGAIQVLAVGLVASYVGRIFEQVKGRPIYLIKDKFNF